MMKIDGLGDPTSGVCGYSFVRLPMKVPNSERPQSQNDPSLFLGSNRMVTGTTADLRTLTMAKAKEKLLSFGIDEARIDRMTRWERVAMLRLHSSQQVANGGAPNKFARGTRVTTKEQKEKY